MARIPVEMVRQPILAIFGGPPLDRKPTQAPVRTGWIYTDAEARLLVTITARQQGSPSREAFLWVSGPLSLAAGLAAHWFGSVPRLADPTVAVLCILACYGALYAGDWLDTQMAPRRAAKQIATFVALSYTTEIDDVGIAGRTSDSSLWWGWSIITRFGQSEGFIVAARQGGGALYIPKRAMSENDRERIAGFHRAARSPTTG